MTPAKIMSIAPTAAAVEFTALSAIAADGCKVRPRRNADVDRARTRCADMENVMLEVLQFIFSSFWIWLGTVILIGAAGQSIAAVILSLRAR